jgi:NAD(P)-dependent dehydrogenase (short-subunit alcohol dehydrogenase family)
MAQSFTDRVALVTGGASGIGRAAALAFAQSGAKVVVSDINEAGADETVQMIDQASGEAKFIPADVTHQDEVATLIKAIVESYGQLDFALNNAGIAGVRTNTADYPDDLWHRLIDVNLNGVWYCMKHEIRQMLIQGHGVIVNLASIAGLIGSPRLSAYAASKHAVVGLTKTAALEYIRKGIRINAICPAYTDTPMAQSMFEENPEFGRRLLAAIPAQRLGTPEEIAAAVLYMCSDEAAFMTGHTLVLDGGIVAG